VIEVISGVLPGENAHLEQAFRLRHRVFVEELGWQPLCRPDGREIDQFDDADSTHFLAICDDKVEGYFRSRPTAKPHLLADIHFQLCSRPYPRSLSVLEWTRYCVAPARREGGAFGGVGSELIVAGMEWSLHRGIRDVVLEYHPAWIARFMGLGFKVHALGLPDEIEGEPVIAVHMQFDQKALERTRIARGVTDPVLLEVVSLRNARRSVA
jgi:acyl-homoserine lactone synthase